MIFCDKCQFPVMGFSWRLVKCNGSKDSYDLCFTHYNENEDPYAERRFYCIIPSGDIDIKKKRWRRAICMPILYNEIDNAIVNCLENPLSHDVSQSLSSWLVCLRVLRLKT